MFRKKVQFILTFTTGRSGTGFLSQAFGHGQFKKETMHRVGDAVVTHESWRGVPIERLKEIDLYSRQATKIVTDPIRAQERLLKKEFPGISKYLIADHKVGRFLAPSIQRTWQPYKVLRIHRNESDVLRSFTRIYNERKRDTDPETFARFYRNNWSRNYYAPSDFSACAPLSLEEWNNMDYRERFMWYIEEVNRQWEKVRQRLPRNRYLEVAFDELINEQGLEKIEDFIKIPYSKEWCQQRANRFVKTAYS